MKFIKNWLTEYKFPLLAFIIWRLVLGFFSWWVANKPLPLHPTFPYYESELAPFYPRSLSNFAFFDGIHYLRLAKYGYVDTGTQAFFPLYPLTIRLFHYLTGINYLKSALVLSTSYILLALLLIWHTFNKKTAKKIILLLLTFPTSFFFVSVYTESLFIFLFSLWIYLAKKYLNSHTANYLFQMAIVAGFTTATRITGLALSLATTYLIWSFQANFQNKVRNLNAETVPNLRRPDLSFWLRITKFLRYTNFGWLVRNLLTTIISFSGFLTYMFYLWHKFHDPFMFLHVQSMFGANRANHLIFPLQTLWRYLKIMITATPTTLLYWRAFFELFIFLWGIFLIYQIYQKVRNKRLKAIYLITSLIMLSLSSFTGTLSSIPRYFLVILPLFYVWAKLYHSNLTFYLTLLFLTFLQLVTFLLFTTGTFVA